MSLRLVPVALFALTTWAHAHGLRLERPLPAGAARARLHGVAQAVRTERSRGGRPVVVFDVDDTLIDQRARPVPGIARFVKRLDRAGATVVYLSGRPESLRARTRAQLSRAGLPIDRLHPLLLRRSATLTPLESKARARAEVEAHGAPVAFFDNDKANVRLFQRQYPGAEVFRLDTRSSHADPGGPPGVHVIRDYGALSGSSAAGR